MAQETVLVTRRLEPPDQIISPKEDIQRVRHPLLIKNHQPLSPPLLPFLFELNRDL